MFGHFSEDLLNQFREEYAERGGKPCGASHIASSKTCKIGKGGEGGTSSVKDIVSNHKKEQIDPVVKSAKDLKEKLKKTSPGTPEHEKLKTEWGQAMNRYEELKRETFTHPETGKKRTWSQLNEEVKKKEDTRESTKGGKTYNQKVAKQKADLEAQVTKAIRNGDREEALRLKREIKGLG